MTATRPVAIKRIEPFTPFGLNPHKMGCWVPVKGTFFYFG